MTDARTSIEDLLLHADFLRRVARDLAADAVGADELVQSVWLRALQSGPRHDGSLRGWLRRTVHRVWSNERRRQQRQVRREQAAARHETVPSTDEILVREQTREVIVRAVLALEEPFRQTLLLRYWENLPPRAIAARLGVPVATVRSRTARALERLRAGLDKRHGGDRAAWTAALLPWAKSFPSVLAMKKLFVAAVALLVLTVSFAALAGFDAGRGGSGMAGPLPVAAVASEGGAAAPTAEPDAPARESIALAIEPPPVPLVYPADRGRGEIRGFVVDEDGAPRADVAVTATPHMGNLPPMHPIADDRAEIVRTVTGADGSFVLAAVAEGPLLVRAERGGREATKVTAVTAGELREPMWLTLAPRETRGDDVRIHVISAADQSPVAGAEVEVYGWSPARALTEFSHRKSKPLFSARTDESGLVVAKGLGIATGGIVLARMPENLAGLGIVGRADSPDPQHVLVMMAPGGSVRGRLRAAAAALLDDAMITLHSTSSPDAAYAVDAGMRIERPVEGGSFAVEGLAAGTYSITLASPGGGRLLLDRVRWGDRELPDSVSPAVVEVRAGEVTEWEGDVVVGGSIVGVVRSGGRPVLGARVRCVLAPNDPDFSEGNRALGVHVWRLDGLCDNEPHVPAAYATATTNAEGRYVLRGLPPGNHRLELSAAGLVFDRRMDVSMRDGEVLRLEHDLEPAGVLQVATQGVSHVAVTPAGADAPCVVAIVRDECATFPGLAPGHYRVTQWERRGPQRTLGEAAVIAGRTTWLDLRRTCVQSVWTGRVLIGVEPFVDARVSFYTSVTSTDSQGAFRLDLSRPIAVDPVFGPSLRIHHDGLEWAVKPHIPEPSTAAQTDIQLGTRRIEINAFDSNGARVPARVQLDAEDRSAGVELHGTLALPATGAAVVAPVPSGRFIWRLRFEDGLVVGLVIPADASGTIAVRRPATATLRVRVTLAGLPAEGCGLTMFPTGASAATETALPTWQEARTDATGSATVSVQPGEYGIEVCCGASMFQAKRVTVPAAGEVHTVEVALPLRR